MTVHDTLSIDIKDKQSIQLITRPRMGTKFKLQLKNYRCKVNQVNVYYSTLFYGSLIESES